LAAASTASCAGVGHGALLLGDAARQRYRAQHAEQIVEADGRHPGAHAGRLEFVEPG